MSLDDRKRYRRHARRGHNRLGILWVRWEGRLAFCEECGQRLPFDDKPTAWQRRRWWRNQPWYVRAWKRLRSWWRDLPLEGPGETITRAAARWWGR